MRQIGLRQGYHLPKGVQLGWQEVQGLWRLQ